MTGFFPRWRAAVAAPRGGACLVAPPSGLLAVAALVSMTLALLPASPAGAATDFFLHGAGPNNNPPTLFLDTAAPTAGTAKFRDSTSVNFSGGNPWKEIALLALRGLSNREIAALLFICEQTVKDHLYATFSKLTIHRRSQLAARLCGFLSDFPAPQFFLSQEDKSPVDSNSKCPEAFRDERSASLPRRHISDRDDGDPPDGGRGGIGRSRRKDEVPGMATPATGGRT